MVGVGCLGLGGFSVHGGFFCFGLVWFGLVWLCFFFFVLFGFLFFGWLVGWLAGWFFRLVLCPFHPEHFFYCFDWTVLTASLGLFLIFSLGTAFSLRLGDWLFGLCSELFFKPFSVVAFVGFSRLVSSFRIE